MTLEKDIIQLIENETISDQQTLGKKLATRGHAVVQSTLSRHLKRLGVKKERGVYVVPRRIAKSNSPVERILLAPPNLIVIRTAPGHAHAIGFQLDEGGFEDIAGIVAGDDTLFVAVTAPENLISVQKELQRKLSPK